MKRRAFTLIELLVTITIIGILSGLVFAGISVVRQTAAEAATKATIEKLHQIIMRRYESYATRRVAIRLPPSIESLSPSDPARVAFEAKWSQPQNAARKRLDAIRDTIRMEMPDATTDITSGPIAFEWGAVSEPAVHRMYATNPPTITNDPAQCLYMIVSRLSPESMGQFAQSEIGTIDGKPCFVDGWGNPIMWLRFAPGYTSDMQSGDQAKDHDPFDPRRVDGFAFRLVPLIYSGGPDGKFGIELGTGAWNGNPFASMDLGKKIDDRATDNITNQDEKQ